MSSPTKTAIQERLNRACLGYIGKGSMQRIVRAGSARFQKSALAQMMFKDRLEEFVRKKGWALEADPQGGERDAYDAFCPTYLFVTDEMDSHIASARMMPISGPTMARDVFSKMFDAHVFEESRTWEVSRFLGASGSGRTALQHLMLNGLEFGLSRGLTSYVGVTEKRMVAVFRALGWPTDVLKEGQSDEGPIAACRWAINREIETQIRSRLENTRFHPFKGAPSESVAA